MKPRLVFVGLLAGLLVSVALSIVFKNIWPGYIGPEFSVAGINPDLAWAGYVLASLLIFASGYIAARLEWSHDWKDALLAGASTGLLAGCLAYLLSSAPAASGIMGQKEILLSIPHAISGDQEGLKLLTLGVVNSMVWVQGVFWIFLLSSITLGGLGGFISRLEGPGGWGKPPALKAPNLPRLVVYTLGFFAIFNIVITVAVLAIMPDLLLKNMAKTGGVIEGMLVEPNAVLLLPLITTMAFVVPCLVLAMWWAFQGWKNPKERLGIIVSGILLGLSIFIFFFFSYQMTFLAFGILILVGLAIWAVQRFQPHTAESEATPFQPYNGLDLLASALTQGILSSALAVGSLIAYALTIVLITVVNITHLTNTGTLESTGQEQILSLYTTSTTENIILLGIASVIGFILAGIGLWTGLLRPPAQPQPLQPD